MAHTRQGLQTEDALASAIASSISFASSEGIGAISLDDGDDLIDQDGSRFLIRTRHGRIFQVDVIEVFPDDHSLPND